MVNYTALNESETSGGSECVPNRTDDDDIETDPVMVCDISSSCYMLALINTITK